eukprot:gene1795-937_t
MSTVSQDELNKLEEEYQKNHSTSKEEHESKNYKDEEYRSYKDDRYSKRDYDDRRYRGDDREKHYRRYRDEDDDSRKSRRCRDEDDYRSSRRHRSSRDDYDDRRYKDHRENRREEDYDERRSSRNYRDERREELYEIFVGGIPFEAKESEIYDLFSEFGKINKCHLVRNRETGEHKGFGFIKFYEKKNMEEAIEKMNGSQFLGKFLKVNEAAKKDEKYNKIKINREEDIKISHSNRYILMQKLARTTEENPSKCIVLKNMVEPEAIDNELQEEIKDECSKFGKVEQLIIYQQEVNSEIDVKVFVLFNTVEGATKAQSKLHNRFFDAKRVHCEFYDEKAFLERNFEE